MRIETPRAVLRHLSETDFEALYSLTRDADSLKYMGDGKPLTPEFTGRWIDVSIANYADHDYGVLAVDDKPSGQFAGFAGFIRTPDVTLPDEAELIYALKPAYRGKGLAVEIVTGLLDYGFATLNFRRVLATIDPANLPSVHIVQKLGFTLTETKADEHGMETLFFWLTTLQWRNMR